MAKITITLTIRCDRCGEVFAETELHGWLVIREGFGDVRHDGTFSLFQDLCKPCFDEVMDCATGHGKGA